MFLEDRDALAELREADARGQSARSRADDQCVVAHGINAS
jgi:hypothetical protein